MRRVELQTILFFLYYTYTKVLVIDDLGVTNSLNSNKKDLIDEVRKKIKSENEEVVIYGKNGLNRGTRISSDDFDPSKKRQQQEDLQRQIQKINNQKIINSLKRLVGMPRTPNKNNSNIPIPESFGESDTRKLNSNPRVFKLGDIKGASNGIEIDEPIIEGPQPNVNPQKYDFDNILGDIKNKVPTNNDEIPPPQFNYSYTFPTERPSPPKDFNVPYNDTPNYFETRPEPPIQHFEFDSFNQPNENTKDNISLLKSQERINLLKAINNRKEYLRIKINEVHSKKERISQQLGEYKSKIDEILNHINQIKNNRDSLLTKMNMEKNHISNLSQNTKDIKDKEDNLRTLIRVTRNEILRYKSLLENEKSKMDVLEKQYEVYENTLRKYNNEVNQEGDNLSKFTNELCKYENDLKDLNDMFSTYKNKNIELNNELKRQAKLESNLEMEENKINRNSIDDLI